MKEFFTRDKANEGMEFPLTLPNGEKSKHWIRILGVDSDAFHRCERKGKQALLVARQVAKAMDDKKDAQEYILEKQAEEELNLISSLVVGWSFDEDCTFENVKNFLENAPQIADAINTISAKREFFFTEGLKSSGDMQEEK